MTGGRAFWQPLPGTSGGGDGALLAQVTYRPGTDTSVSVTSTSFVDVDATNLVIPFTAPDSGDVFLVLEALCDPPSLNTMFWALRSGTTTVTGSPQYIGRALSTNGLQLRHRATIPVSGLTPSASYTYKWAARVSGGTGNVYMGGGAGTYGTAVMQVWSA